MKMFKRLNLLPFGLLSLVLLFPPRLPATHSVETLIQENPALQDIIDNALRVGQKNEVKALLKSLKCYIEVSEREEEDGLDVKVIDFSKVKNFDLRTLPAMIERSIRIDQTKRITGFAEPDPSGATVQALIDFFNGPLSRL